MRNNYWFKGFLTLVFMLPVVSFAATLDLSPSAGDVSMGYLRATFGTVENVFEGTGSYIIGQMFRTFNAAVLTVGGFVLMYILIVSTINTAHSGEVLGKKWSSIWVPVRAAFGIALLLPKGSGYCLIQTLVMWVVVQGIGAADRVWEAALGYLNTGGILITEEDTLSDTNFSATADAEVQLYAQNLAANYLKIAACNYALEKMSREKALTQSGKSVPNFDSTVEFTLENVTKDTNAPGEFIGREAYTQAYEGVCGSFKMGGADSGDEAKKNNVNSVVALAHESLYSEMARIARRYVDSGFQPIENEDDSMAAAAIEFYYMLKVASDLLIEYESEDTSFIDSAKGQGWMMAGIYYYKLTAFTNKEIQAQGNIRSSTAEAANASTFKNSVNSPTPGPSDDFSYFVELTGGELDQVKNHILSNSSKLQTYITTATAGVTLPQQTNTQGVQSEANAVGVLAAFGIIGYLLIGLLSAAFGMLGIIMFVLMSVAMGRILWALDDLLISHTMNPLVAMSMLGFNLMDLALTLFVGGGIGIFAIGVGASVGACMNPLPYALQMLLQWLMPILAFILVAMMTSGAVLMLYIPMIPFLVFIFASLGWFFAVIEAMVAAPLVALGFIHPEGHEVFGKGESALMLLLNVFLRPTMLIIGFILTSVLSFIGIWLLNIAYFEAFFGMMFANALGTAGAAWLLAFPLSIFVYGALAIYVLQYIFDYMPKLADEVLIWIGGPSRNFGAGVSQAAGQLKGAVASTAQGLGTAMGQSMAKGQKLGEKMKAHQAENSGDTEIGSEDSLESDAGESSSSGSSASGSSGGGGGGGGSSAGGGGKSGGGGSGSSASGSSASGSKGGGKPKKGGTSSSSVNSGWTEADQEEMDEEEQEGIAKSTKNLGDKN